MRCCVRHGRKVSRGQACEAHRCRDLNDYAQHKKIARAIKERASIAELINVPDCHYFVPSSRTTWFDNQQGLIHAATASKSCKLPTAALVAERVHPLPQVTRNVLIEKYCAPHLKERAYAAPGNKHCLARVYLGSMEGRKRMFFNLQNFKLHYNQLVELGLDVDTLARRMGCALAVMHWAAKIDAQDVELVLGSSTRKTTAPDVDLQKLQPMSYNGPETDLDYDLTGVFRCRLTGFWLIDFDRVRDIKMDETEVAMAVQAFWLNDPYYSRPLKESEVESGLWETFVQSHLRTFDEIWKEKGVGKEIRGLPNKFILGVVEQGEIRLARQTQLRVSEQEEMEIAI
ncbi:hypothetical protein N658DRAFT_502366 [Parathielavia hyrcaniae]|uniref:DUF3669 domain-containing protein n=1 Tax=Parathielavia hyrcaniae TaxID=113614 RepID=A0AAN6PUA3_9PEZI|nr:hypothetical protein N658DRAFT_502366 [Parathielavia hyrcaniae]